MSALELFEKAKWIWPNNAMYLLNSYAGFRYDLELKTLPANAPVHLTADQSYRLWVNGRYVCRGPVRGQQKEWQFDTVDIVQYLKGGHNFIAVEGYQPGHSTFAYTFRDRAGFIFAAKWENGTEVYSDESWKIFRASGYNPHTGRLSRQMNYQEDLDLRKDDRSWIYQENPNIPAQPQWLLAVGMAFGSLPWSKLKKRVLPMLDESCHAPAKAVLGGTGVTAAANTDVYDNIAWHFADRELPSIEWHDAPEFIHEGEFLTGTVPAAGKGKFNVITFDLGEEWMTGTPILEVLGGRAGDVVELYYYHYLEDGKCKQTPPPGVGSMLALASRLCLNGDACRHEFYQIMGSRHFTLLVRETETPLDIRISWRNAVYPLEIKGQFNSSNPLWNDLYRISRHTQQVCSMDVFVDTPWREQSQWWGDARVQAKNTHFLSGDVRLLEEGLFSITAQSDVPHGLIFANAPTTQAGNILPDFCLTWIATLYDLYFQTGRTDFFPILKNRAESIFTYFETQRNQNGLIGYDKRFWLFEDWAELPKQPYPCFLNLWHCYVLELYCKLLQAAGDDFFAVAKKITHERELLVKMFYDPTKKLFLPILDENGMLSGTPSVHDQVLAILLGLVPEAHGTMVVERIRPCLLGTLTEGAVPSPFWATYMLDAVQKLGLYEEALSYIRQNWSPMIPVGTTWEVFDPVGRGGLSFSHAWSAHLISHLTEILGGITQLEARWQKIRFSPYLPTGEKTLSVTLPTPAGMIKAAWEKHGETAEYTLELPDGVTAEVVLPGLTRTVSGKWHYRN